MSDQDDKGFEAVLAMRNEPLVLDEREAAIFDRLSKERVPRLAKPLPVESSVEGET